LIDTVYNFKRLSPLIATGGQPNENQLQNLSVENYIAGINLGLDSAEYAVANEKQLVENQGIQYIHIPVSFDSPNTVHYFEFEKHLIALMNKRILIHCAANKRVSVFMALFRMLNQQVTYADAMKDVYEIWQPDNVWQRFIRQVIEISASSNQ